MTAPNTPNPSVPDDALASGSPAGDGGFDGHHTNTGFTDGAGRSVKHGDEVQYRDGRHGIVGECMPDGDADITFFDGKGPNLVKWRNLAGVPPEYSQRTNARASGAKEDSPMNNTDAVSVEGFDPSRPFTTRDGRQVIHLLLTGYLSGHVGCRSWTVDGKSYGAKCLDLINTPTPTAPPTPAGDMAGEDDHEWQICIGILESLPFASEQKAALRNVLAREGALREKERLGQC